MTILCGTDFSDDSLAAARVAVAMAARGGERLDLVHAFSLPLTPVGLDTSFVRPELLDMEPFRKRLGEVAEGLSAVGVRVHPILEVGFAEDVLVERAKDKSVRLVVVASRGRSKRARLLLGSTAERTARSSPKPVLVLRDPAAFEAWSRGERPLRVLVAADLSVASRAALEWVRELQAFGPCAVTVARIAWPLGEHGRLGIPSVIPLDGFVPEVEAILRREIDARAAEIGLRGVTTLVRSSIGRVDVDIVRLTDEVGCDLVVVGSRQRKGLDRFLLGSVARGVLHAASTNVACVPSRLHEPDRFAREIASPRAVLAATDLTRSGDDAASHAFGLVREGGSVRLVHALEPGEVQADVEEHLRRLVPASAAARGVEVSFEVVRDRRPADAVFHAAERFGAELVCVGARSLSDATRRLLGSVAEEVALRTRRPLLVVPAPDER